MVTKLRKADISICLIQIGLINHLLDSGLGDTSDVVSQSELVAVLRRSALGLNAEGLELAGFIQSNYGLDGKTVVDAFYEAASEAEEHGRKVTIVDAAKLIYDRLK